MASVVVTMSADEARLWKAQQKIIEQQTKLERKFSSTAQVSRNSAEKVRQHYKQQDDAVTQVKKSVGAYAASFATVEVAIQSVMGYLQNQIELQRESLELAKNLGKAQQEAAKNLTGLTTAQKAEVFKQASKIAVDVGFSDLPALQEAMGQVTSLTGGDLQLATAAVTEAARLNPLTPDGVAPMAAAIADIAKSTGVTGEGLASGFILETQAQSHIRNVELLAKNLTPVLATATGAFDGSDTEVARETAALFAFLSQRVADDTGERTKTSSVQILSGLDKFFDNLDNFKAEQATALEKLLLKSQVTEGEQLRIDKAQFDLDDVQRKISRFGTPRTEEQKRDFTELKLEERSAQQRLADTKTNASLNKEEQAQLKNLQMLNAELKNVRDGVTVQARFETLRQNPELQKQFIGQASFGEESFRQPIVDLLRAGSEAAQQYAKTIGSIDFDAGTFQNAANEAQEGITPEAMIAIERQRKESLKTLALNKESAQVQAFALETAKETLQRTRLNNVFGVGNTVTEFGDTSYISTAGSGRESLDVAIEALEARERDIRYMTFTGDLSRKDLDNLADLERNREMLERIRGKLDSQEAGIAMPSQNRETIAIDHTQQQGIERPALQRPGMEMSDPGRQNRSLEKLEKASELQLEVARELRAVTSNLANQPPRLPPSQIGAARRQAQQANIDD